MPTTDQIVKYQIKRYYFNGPKLVNSTVSNQDVKHRSVTFPSVSRRALPSDLFASGTARTTSSIYQNCNTYDYATNDGDDHTVGRPAAAMFTSTGPSSSLFPMLPSIDVGAMDNHARNEFRGQAVNLAMALAEYRQTAKLFMELSKAVRTKGASFVEAVSRKKGVSKAWLGFQYGVKPLASDIIGSIEELRNGAMRPCYITRVETRKEFAFTQRKVRMLSTWHNYDQFEEFHHSRRQRCQYRVKLNTNPIATVLTAHGFTNPFNLAYELVPFSFVFDWWMNIGEVLASFDNYLLFDELKVQRSTRTIRSYFAQSPGVGGRNFMTPWSYSWISRTDVRSVPFNLTKLNVYRYKPSVSLTHILNGMALVRVNQERISRVGLRR